MNSDADSFKPIRVLLAEHADHLNGIRWPRPFGKPFYELMSGALVWPDETNAQTPTEVIGALRFIWSYRTSIILAAPREELGEVWRFGMSAFPRWVGFRPGRRIATPKLLRIYRAGDVGLRKCLRDLEREEAEA